MPCNTSRKHHRSILITLLYLPAITIAEHMPTTPDDMIQIDIEGGTVVSTDTFAVNVDRTQETSADSAALLKRAPGANVNRNGPLTGLVQYRGMYGQRVNTRVDGMHISSGGPNGMDPPLSYIPRSRLESLEILRGIAPVSSGLETIGGTVIARSRHGHFGTDNDITPQANLSTGVASVDSSSFANAMGTLATRQHRLDLYGTRERGSNYKYGDGKVKPTRYERDNFGAGYGYRTGAHEFAVDLTRNETNPTGTPSLPMDIVLINTTMAQGEYNGELAGHFSRQALLDQREPQDVQLRIAQSADDEHDTSQHDIVGWWRLPFRRWLRPCWRETACRYRRPRGKTQSGNYRPGEQPDVPGRQFQ